MIIDEQNIIPFPCQKNSDAQACNDYSMTKENNNKIPGTEIDEGLPGMLT